MTQVQDDAQLVARIEQGDPQAERILIDRYSTGVWAILARWRVRGAVEASDLYQETWDVVIRKIRAGQTTSPEAIKAFIASTARFVLNGAYRHEKLRDHGTDDPIDLEDATPPSWMRLDARFRARLVRQFLKQLGPGHRDLLFMYFVSEHSREEICMTLGITRETLSRRLYAAKIAFRKFLDDRMPNLRINNE